MPTIFAHAVVGWAQVRATAAGASARVLTKLGVAAAALAMLPDADVVGFGFGVRYGDLLGHRGLTHSLAFAALASGLAAVALRVWREASPWRCWAALLAGAVSHPLLDMLTNGGLGCALLAPLWDERLFFPVRPIPVSPIGVHASLYSVMVWETALFGPIGLAAVFAGRPWPWRRRAAMIAAALAAAGAVWAWRLWSSG